MTGSTLRTARVLEEGQIEVSAGLAATEFGGATQVVIGAYGITDRLEIEGRWEDEFGAITPRFQILKSESAYIDGLAFFEFGYSKPGGFQWGPGVIVGRRWNFIEPYLSYRFRHFTAISSRQKDDQEFQMDFSGASSYHYLKLGSRFYFSCLWNNPETDPKVRSSKWFIGLEGGPTFFLGDVILEWAANLGLDY